MTDIVLVDEIRLEEIGGNRMAVMAAFAIDRAPRSERGIILRFACEITGCGAVEFQFLTTFKGQALYASTARSPERAQSHTSVPQLSLPLALRREAT